MSSLTLFTILLVMGIVLLFDGFKRDGKEKAIPLVIGIVLIALGGFGVFTNCL